MARGVMPDGVVGPGTRRLLNQQHHQRAGNAASTRLILLNMERWRWLPSDLGPFYVTVNIPEFTLRVVEDGKVAHSTRVVVGKPDKQTPVFYKDMQEIVFNPIWNVPNSIKTEELLPAITGGGGTGSAAAMTPRCSSATASASIWAVATSILPGSTGAAPTSAR